MNKYPVPKRFVDQTYNVWVEFSELAVRTKALNLGQGFPDFSPAPYLTDALKAVAVKGDVSSYQYSRDFGLPKLVKSLGVLYSKVMRRNVDPFGEILITCGAYEALYCAITSNVDEGDEVIVIEPYFDCYVPMILSAGGKPVYIALNHGGFHSDDWKLDENELRSLFSHKTKMILLNTPNNPLGKVFTVEELMFIARLCVEFDVLCVSDEVYEWVVFDPAQHVKIATLPGMWERTITIGSAGKSFSATGWKCGWLYGHANLVANACVVHQNLVGSNITPIQEAIAACVEREIPLLGNSSSYFETLATEFRQKRDYFVDILKSVGLSPITPSGGYFILAQWNHLVSDDEIALEDGSGRDFKFAKWLTKEANVLGIPPSAFYSKYHKYVGENFIRFCFVKKEETLRSAAEKLLQWKKNFKK